MIKTKPPGLCSMLIFRGVICPTIFDGNPSYALPHPATTELKISRPLRCVTPIRHSHESWNCGTCNFNHYKKSPFFVGKHIESSASPGLFRFFKVRESLTGIKNHHFSFTSSCSVEGFFVDLPMSGHPTSLLNLSPSKKIFCLACIGNPMVWKKWWIATSFGCFSAKDFSSWWLNQPIWNILVKLGSFPQVWGEHKKIFETTT